VLVVTVTSTEPGSAAGMTATMVVGDLTVNALAGFPPNETLVTSVKFVPVIVTLSPPLVEALEALRPVTVGSAPAGVNANLSAGTAAEVPLASGW